MANLIKKMYPFKVHLKWLISTWDSVLRTGHVPGAKPGKQNLHPLESHYATKIASWLQQWVHLGKRMDVESKIWKREKRFVLESLKNFTTSYLETMIISLGGEISMKLTSFDPTLGWNPELLKRAGNPPISPNALRQIWVDELSSFIKIVKGHCGGPAAFSFRSTTELMVPLSGGIKKHLRRLLRFQRSGALLFLNTCLQLKRVVTTVPECFINSSVEGYRDRLSLPPRQSPEFVTRVRFAAERYLLTDYLWKVTPCDDVHDLTLRSCIENKVKKGGVFGYYSQRLGTTVQFKTDEFGVSAQHGIRFPLIQELQDDLNEIYFSGERRGFLSEVVALAEPCKVRCITINSAPESPLWSGVQKTLQNHLLRYPEIISGRDYDASSFDWVFKNRRLFEKETGEEWVIISDDGSAATDSIDTRLSNDLIKMRIPDFLKEDWTACWLEREIVLPNGERFTPSTGQPMGDRRSFPLLCVIHAATKLAFLEDQGLLKITRIRNPDTGKWERHQVYAVNGDDGLILLPRRLVDKYNEWMEELWGMNPLKTYIDTQHFSFNSTLFKESKDGTCKQIDIIRWNLILGLDKDGSDIQDPRVWNEIKTSCERHAAHLWGCFHKSWAPKLKILTTGGNNYFLPTNCGGLGLNAPIPFKVTGRQYAAIKETYAAIATNSKRLPYATSVVQGDAKTRKREKLVRKPKLHRIHPVPPTYVADAVGHSRPGNFKSASSKTFMYTRTLPRQGTGKVCYASLWNLTLGYSRPDDDLLVVSSEILGASDSESKSSLTDSEQIESLLSDFSRWYDKHVDKNQEKPTPSETGGVLSY